jgi:hypothetical protein
MCLPQVASPLGSAPARRSIHHEGVRRHMTQALCRPPVSRRPSVRRVPSIGRHYEPLPLQDPNGGRVIDVVMGATSRKL